DGGVVGAGDILVAQDIAGGDGGLAHPQVVAGDEDPAPVAVVAGLAAGGAGQVEVVVVAAVAAAGEGEAHHRRAGQWAVGEEHRHGGVGGGPEPRGIGDVDVEVDLFHGVSLVVVIAARRGCWWGSVRNARIGWQSSQGRS